MIPTFLVVVWPVVRAILFGVAFAYGCHRYGVRLLNSPLDSEDEL